MVGTGFWIGFYFFKPGPFYVDANLLKRLLVWDGGWYLRISQNSYIESKNQLYSDFAFFPLYPLIEYGLRYSLHLSPIFIHISTLPSSHFIFKSHKNGFTPLAYIAPSVIFGIASIWAIFELSKEVLSEDLARFATISYALYPGSQFFFAGYPTSLINLLTILSLLALLKNKFWLAAIYAGIASAAGPLASLLIAVILIKYIKTSFSYLGTSYSRIKFILIRFLSGIYLSVIGISGLIFYVSYQLIAFNNPLLFLQAQSGWGHAILATRINNLFHLYPLYSPGTFEVFLNSLFLN